MNVSAASRRSITSLRLTRNALGFAQQHPWEAVFYGRSKLRGIDPKGLKVMVIGHKALRAYQKGHWT